MSKQVALERPPHADVRIVSDALWKLENALGAMGLSCPALTEAREMLLRQSIEIEAHRKKEATDDT